MNKCLGTHQTQEHRWAPMVKKNIDCIDTDNRLTAKTLIRSMVVRRKNILSRWIDTIGQKSIFLPMTNTIGQFNKIFNRRIDTIIVKHD
jgi:hypothetical protein